MRNLLHRSFAAWICGTALLTAATDAYAPPAAPRIALVIGNSKHQQLGQLRTARNDAEDVAKALVNLGFQVIPKFDAELGAMQDGLREFSDKLRSEPFLNALAVFYFDGYGLQSDGRNFLLPTGFDAERDRQDLDKAAIALDGQIIKAMGGRAAGSNVIILDACRDDPFGQRTGLAQVDDVPPGTLIGLAAAPNTQAIETLDPKAPERNSIYTKQLLQKLEKPSPEIDLEQFFNIVGNNVYEASNRKQKPRVMTSANVPAMPEKISLAPQSAKTQVSAEELALWRRIEKSAAACDFEQYLKQYPDGEFADSARATISSIQSKNQVARRAFGDLPQVLRAHATQSFQKELAETQARCGRNISKSTSDPKALLRFVEMRRRLGSWVDGFSRPQYPGVARLSYAVWTTGERKERRAVVDPTGHARERFVAERSAWTVGPEERSPFPNLRVAQESPPSAASRREIGDDEFRAELLKAQQGDMNAMFRVALIYERGTHDVDKDVGEMMRWLVLSSSLGNGLASYKLYRYFAEQPVSYAKAVKFKRLAGEQGYYGPPALSNRR